MNSVCHSIAEYEVNAHAYGKHIVNLPREEFSDGRIPKAFFMTREIYERLLRRLVLGRSKRIRWKVATATGACLAPDDCKTISSVRIRTPDGAESDVPATLIIGMSRFVRYRSSSDEVSQIALERRRPVSDGYSGLRKIPSAPRPCNETHRHRPVHGITLSLNITPTIPTSRTNSSSPVDTTTACRGRIRTCLSLGKRGRYTC